MVYLVQASDILAMFRTTSFEQLNQKLDSMAPSLSDFYLEDLVLFSQESLSFNRSYIQNSIYNGIYTLYLDYEGNIFIEKDDTYDDDDSSTNSLW